MNVDFLLGQIGRRLEEQQLPGREPLLEVVREELLRERQRLGSAGPVELERERRVEAETLREVLEAINRQARLEDTIAEVLRQLERLVAFDSCTLALVEDGRYRVIAARGFPAGVDLLGQRWESPLLDELRRSHWPLAVADVQQDPRYRPVPGAAPVRSWVGLPLLVEGEVIGVLGLDRRHLEPFGEEDLHRARAVAFSAAAAIRKAQLLLQVRRYATLMEQVVAVDHAVFAGKPAPEVMRLMLQGALRVGSYRQGLLVLSLAGRLELAACAGAEEFESLIGRPAPLALGAARLDRLSAAQVGALAAEHGLALPVQPLLLVPLVAGESYLGCLVLFDVDGESPDDRLMEAYASRVATAYRHALVDHARQPD